MPAKLLGLALLGGGFLAYLRYRRTLARGFTGSRRRRIERERSPFRFKLALASQITAILICLFAGALCLSHGLRY